MSDRDDVIRAMDAVNRIFEQSVIREGRFDALDQVYTRNARIFPPGAAPITGREAIRSFWRHAVGELGLTSCRLQPFEVELLGDTALEMAVGEIGGEAGAVPIKYLVVWKREDGAWKWHQDIWNMSA